LRPSRAAPSSACRTITLLKRFHQILESVVAGAAETEGEALSRRGGSPSLAWAIDSEAAALFSVQLRSQPPGLVATMNRRG
jgi:hypothetical protein